MLSYRRDIDGLRAIAVVPVILFHSGLGIFPGGYVGVDVFFVISGFLITGLLRNELESGRFSIARFYERRVRRLFPALFAMVAATSVAAWWLLSPAALREFGQSVVATSAFASNIFFWLESDYFARASESLPLLHTWSLAVEEQYYLVFPPLLWLLARNGRGAIVTGLGVLTVLSLGASAWMVSHHPEQAFYLPHLRAWELFVGALAAYGVLPVARHNMLREVLACAGLLAIIVAMMTFDAGTPFPGFAALLPCLGTVAIIHAGVAGPTRVSALLCTRVAVGTGLISYSLYLWHWPVFVLQRHYTVLPPAPTAIFAAIAVTFVLAALSWRFVEQPLRGNRWRGARLRLFSGAAAVIAAFVALGLASHFTHGFPARFPADSLSLKPLTLEYLPLRDRCFQKKDKDYEAGDVCRIGAPGAPPDFILWGDSHALMLLQSFMRNAQNSGRAGLFFGAAGCPPLFDVDLANRSEAWRDECLATNAAVRRTLEAQPAIKTVIMVARWARYVDGTEIAPAPTPPPLLVDDQQAAASASSNKEVFERALRRSLDRMRSDGRHIVVLESVPEIAVSVPDALAQLAVLGRAVDEIAPGIELYRQRQAGTHAIFARAATDYPMFATVPVSDALCPQARCRVEMEGLSLYYDDNHLSAHGVSLIEPKLRAMLEASNTAAPSAR